MSGSLHRILFVLLTLRLLLPPGICVCQWHSPAARILAGLFKTGKEVPPSPPAENEDDHEPGCPASKLAAGMGLRPAAQPPLPPAASPEVVDVAEAFVPLATTPFDGGYPAYRPPDASLYLTVCALLI